MATTPTLDNQPGSGVIHPSTLTESERQLWQDHEWVYHDPDIQRTHAGSVVAVSRRTILGVGRTHLEALKAALARPDSPPRQEIVTVAVEGSAIAASEDHANQEHT